jgi:transposase
MNHKDTIIQKEKDGVPIAEIAQEYNVHRNTIYDILRGCGIKRTYNRKMNIAERKEEIIRKYHQGTPIKEIAENENVSMFTIYKYLIKWGAKEKREKIITNRYIERKKSIPIVPFEKRISSELLAKMKENTRINQKYSSRYPYKEEFLVQEIL